MLYTQFAEPSFLLVDCLIAETISKEENKLVDWLDDLSYLPCYAHALKNFTAFFTLAFPT